MKNKNLVTCCNLYKLMGLEKDEYTDITKSLGRYFLYTKDYVATGACQVTGSFTHFLTKLKISMATEYFPQKLLQDSENTLVRF